MNLKQRIFWGACAVILSAMVIASFFLGEKPAPDFNVYTVVTTENDTLEFKLPYTDTIKFVTGDSIVKKVIPNELINSNRFAVINYKNGKNFGLLNLDGKMIDPYIIKVKIIAIDSGYKEYVPRLTK